MESSRFYYLMGVGVLAIFAIFFAEHNPFSRRAMREEAAQKREEAFRKARDTSIAMARQHISLSDFTALQKGMTYDQVAELNGPGKEVGRKIEYYRELVTYRWGDGAPSSKPGRRGYGSWMEVTFADGKLAEARQEGLR